MPHRGKRKPLKMIWNLPVWIICWKSVNERHVVLNVFYWYLSLLVSWLNLPWKLFRLMVSHLKTLVYIPDDPLLKWSKLVKLFTNYKLMLRQKACWPWLSESSQNYFSFIFFSETRVISKKGWSIKQNIKLDSLLRRGIFLSRDKDILATCAHTWNLCNQQNDLRLVKKNLIVFTLVGSC